MPDKPSRPARPDDFVHLHTHSDMSSLDGCGKISAYCDEAKARGNPGISFTDHGTMRGYMTQHEECQRAGIKPIYGVEFYVCRNMNRKGVTDEERAELSKGRTKAKAKEAIARFEEEQGIRQRWHLTVHAQDNEGLRNLYRLTSAAWIDGFYYKPRIDLDFLLKNSNGLIVSSGCMGSIIHDCWIRGQKRYALDCADRLHEALGDRFLLEIQPHAIREQREASKLALALRKRYSDSRLIATQDAHYVHQEHAVNHDVLLCIGTNRRLSDPMRFRFDGDEFHMRTRREMIRAFHKHHEFIPDSAIREALNSTIEMYERCNAHVKVDYHAALLPDPGIPEEFDGDHFVYLKSLCLDGWHWREMPRRVQAHADRTGVSFAEALAEYKNRLAYELKALHRQKFVPYFTIIHDLYRWARGKDIMVGPGRGSVAGCLIAYLIGLTSVDPIEHGLIFERFINPNRIDMPDIDMDFEDGRRQEVFAYLRTKYGEDKVCQIATIGKLSGKQCLKDVSRVLDVPYAEVNQVTNSIIERSSGDERASATIHDSFEEFEVCREFNRRYPAVLKHSEVLEGMAKNLGIHAAGCVASPVPLTDLIPLEIRKHEGRDIVVSAGDMYAVAAAGLVKLDVLGLRTLSVLKGAVRAVKERHGIEIDLESASQVDLNDPHVLKGFTDHDYGGVFQYDTPSADKVCSGVTFDRFEDIAAMTALNRPGTSRSGLAMRYVDRKKNPEKSKKHDFHPSVTKITSDTLGIIVYQEHVIRIFTEVAGFAPGTADSLRKTIAKKIGDETMGKERANFVKGAVEHTGMEEKTAHKIMDAITFFGSYGFNKCIDSNTLVHRAGAGNGQSPEITVKELYEAQESKTAWGYKIRSGNLNLIQMDSDGRCRPGRLIAVHKSGIQELVEINTDGGRSIRVTLNHRLLTDKGYFVAEDLKIGDCLVAMAPPDEYVKIGHQTNRAKGASYPGILGGGGMPVGSENPAWIDGRFVELNKAKTAVQERSDGRCEECGKIDDGGKHSIEFSHLKSLEECGGVFAQYNSHLNLKALCNSFHKKLDYSKGEREKRWSKGRSVLLDRIVEIKCVGKGETYDVEMGTSEHNFIANGIVSHNSHATAYGMIAFWCMWLKTYYPLEFYWSLLKHEPDRIRIQQYAKHAKKRGISFLPPSVSVSKVEFAIDADRNAIRGSLVDIKGVGAKAAEAIIAKQPYTDFVDFLTRVDRRKVHRGVVLALAKAGALDDILPNPRWFVEHIDPIWKQLLKKGESAMRGLRLDLRRSAGKPQWSDEERQLVASRVNPLAFGKHPMDAYSKFIKKNVHIKLASMSDENFYKRYDGRITMVGGIIVEVKLNQIGDFHTGRLPDEDARARMFWGKRYANVNVEDVGGVQNRIKFDWDIYPEMRPLIELGIGSPVLVMASVNAKFENMKAHFAVDMEGLRKRLSTGEPLNIWERIVTGDHPVKHIPAKNEKVARARWINAYYRKGVRGGPFWGVVTNVRLKYDKNGHEMAFFGLVGGNGFMIEVICFHSQWPSVKRVISPGAMLKIQINRQKDSYRGTGVSHTFNGGVVKRFRAHGHHTEES